MTFNFSKISAKSELRVNASPSARGEQGGFRMHNREALYLSMTRAQCSTELPDVQVSDTTDVDSSNTDHYIIVNFILKN